MDQRSFIESLFDTGCGPHRKSPRTLQSQFLNEFVDLNGVLIPEDVHIHGHGSYNPIDLNDINVLEMEHKDEDVELNISDARESEREKTSKMLESL